MAHNAAYCRNDAEKAESRIRGTRPVVSFLPRIDAVTAITAFYGVLLSASCEPNDRRDASSNGTLRSDARSLMERD